MKLFFFLVTHSRRIVLLALLVGVISGVCNALLLAVINAALKNGGVSLSFLLKSFLGLCLILPLTRFISEILLTGMGQKALRDLRLRLSRQILGAPLRYLEEVGAPRLLAALVDDVPTITNALLAVPILIINVAVVVSGLVYMGWLSFGLLLMLLSFVVLGVMTYQLPVIRAVRYMHLAREQNDSLFGHFRSLINGNKELKLHRQRRDAFLAGDLDPTAELFRRNNVKGMMIYSAAATWGHLLVFLLVGMIIFGIPAWKPTNSQILSGYTLTLLYLMSPFQIIMNFVPIIGRAGVALQKIEKLGLSLAAHSKEAVNDSSQSPAAEWRRLELRGVTHTYRRESQDDNFVLGPIDLSLHPGELVFISGGNGSGKTTLAKLLTGLYTPEAGEIYFDELLITDQNREFYRQHFSVVFSDFFLFESLLGLETSRQDEKAQEYLHRLELGHKVTVTDGLLSTTDLSQGQRKRLALLTAYLENRPLYVFDEWAADQDPLFKEVFYLHLLPELKARGKTIVVISHDDKYYYVADRLIKLDYGQLIYDKYDRIVPPLTADPLLSSKS